LYIEIKLLYASTLDPREGPRRRHLRILILLGQPLGVGFLVAAKSILRFGTATRDQRTAEYVIIGTLASFGWAILASYATLALINLLPPLEIARILP